VNRRTTKLGLAKLAAGTVALLLLGIFVSAGLADGGSASSPSVATDQASYLPGDTVNVTGAGWLPGETVHVHAAANSQPFSFDSDVLAGADGSIDASFALPSDYADTFAVAASSALQGSVSTSFSDAFAAAGTAAPPTIVSDQNDYAPGSTVTLTGGGWAAGESVHITVNDTIGQTWKYDGDVVADSSGAFTAHVTLANYFISNYDVTATGSGGELASTAFTDAAALVLTPTSGPVGAAVVVTSTGGGFTGGATNIGLYWDGTINSTSGTLLTTCSVNGGGNINSGCSFTAPSGSLGSHNVVATEKSDTTKSINASFTLVNSAPNNPTNLAQFKADGTTAIAVGATATETTVVLKGTVSDPNADQTRLQVEVKPVGTAFANTATATSSGVASGSTASVSVPSLVNGTSYHWQARAIDSSNATSTGWVSFGGNAETVADFTVQTQQATAISAVSGAGTFGGTATLTATLKAGATALSGKTISFTLSGTSVGTATTNASGIATLAGVSLTGINAGTYTGAVAASFAGDSSFSASNGTGDLTVNTAQADCSSITGYAVTFDGSAHTATGACKDLSGNALAGLNLTGTTHTNVGTYNADPWSFAGTTNYAATSGTVNDKINQAPANCSSITGYTVTYDGSSHTATGACKDLSGNALGGLDLSGTTHTNAGTYNADPWSFAGTTNYAATNGTVNDKIDAKQITVTADDKTKVYGSGDPALTYTVPVGALESGDSLSGALTRGAGETVAGSPYAITKGTLTAGNNYDLTVTPGSLSITTRPVTVTADAKSKTYGNPDPALTYQITSGSLAFSDAFSGSLSRDSGETVAGGPYSITQGSLALSSNYDLHYVGASLSINPRSITVTADSKSKTYGDSDPVLTYQITTGSLAFSDAFGGALSRGAGENVGAHAITQGSLALNGNYDLHYVGANLTIDTRPITVTADPQTKVYGDADPALTYQITSGTLAFTDAFTGGLTRDAGEGVGTYAIKKGTLALSANYDLAYAGADLTITKATLAINADGQTKVYGTGDPTATYSLSGFQFSDTAANSGITGAASCSYTGTAHDVAVYPGEISCGLGTLSAANYDFGGGAKGSLTITTRPVEITADAKSKTYGDDDPALTYQITSGTLAFSDAFTGSLARVAGENVGAHAITQGTVALDSNYDLTYVGANLTIGTRPVEITADSKSKTYGDDDPALTYQITSGTLAFSDAFSGSLARAAGENVGARAITQGTVALSSNYELTYVGANLTITKRPVTITADPKTREYGDADPALTYQVTSGTLAFSDAFSGSLTRDAGENVGGYAITQGTVALSSNYDLSYVGANLTITKAVLSINADGKSKVYGNANPAPTDSFSGFKFTDTTSSSGITGSADCSYAFGSGPDVGSYPGTISCGPGDLSAANYNFAGGAKGDLTITQRPVTITADAKTRTYGDSDPALTYQVTSGTLAFSDAFSGSLTRDAGENVGGYAITQGTVALSANYDLSYVGANLSITKRPVEITADAKSKTYGDDDPALTYQITSGTLAFSDVFSGSLSRVAGEDVGADAITQGTVALDSNYELTYVGANLTIGTRPVEITADPKSKTYGDDDPALTYQITSGTLAFSDAFSGSLARAAGENVGDYAITQGTVALTANYTLSYVGANLSITKRPVTITADAKSKTYGDADPALTYQITSGTLAFSDTFGGSLSRAAGENVGDYAIGQGTVALSANYNLSYVGANLSITQRPVTITADAKTRTYGDSDPALTYQVTSGTLAFSDAFSGSLTRDAGENVGGYAITQGTVALSANYDLSYVGANLSITKATLAINAAGKSKVYGEPDPTPTYSLTGFKFSETEGTVTITGAANCSYAAGSGPNVLVYPGAISCGPGNLSAANYDFAGGGKGNLTITQRPVTITADAKSKTYGNADPALTFQITSGTLAFSDAFSGSLTRDAGETVVGGPYAIRQGSVALNGNYNLSYVGAGLTITQRSVTITADAKSKTYGNADPALSYQITSGTLAFSDAFSGSLTRDAGETVAGSPYAITQGTLTLGGNYNLAYVGANLTIDAKPITGSFTAQNKVYDGGVSALILTETPNGIVGTDVVTLTGGTATFMNKNVGMGKVVTLLGATLAGAGQGNYSLTSVGTTTANISAKPITGSFTAPNKGYDGNVSSIASTRTANGVVGTDTVSLAGGTAAFDNKNVGTGKIVTLTGATLSGGDSTNYSLTSVDTAVADITKAPLTVTADNQAMLLNATVPPLTYKVTGFVGGDTVAVVTGAAACSTANGTAVGTFDIVCTVGTLSAQNYSFPTANFVKGKLAVSYRWDGFLQPINDTAHQVGLAESKFKLGQTIPAKFVLKNAQGVVVQQTGNPAFSRSANLGSCDSYTVPETITEQVTADAGVAYTWDGSQYHYNWSTKGLTAGEYRVFVTLADGSKPYVDICLS
jgi:hypothetical protein